MKEDIVLMQRKRISGRAIYRDIYNSTIFKRTYNVLFKQRDQVIDEIQSNIYVSNLGD